VAGGIFLKSYRVLASRSYLSELTIPCVRPSLFQDRKKRWGFLIFCAGILLGWTIKPASQGDARENSASALAIKAARDRRAEPAKEAHVQKWQSLAKRVASFSPEERESFLEDLAPNDRSKALGALMAKCGPGYTSDNVHLHHVRDSPIMGDCGPGRMAPPEIISSPIPSWRFHLS
jgi:hypothetical protein